MPQEQQAAKAAAKTATLKIERTLHVPLIGAGGAGIRKITADTGAKVRFPAQQEQSDEVHISGSHEQIEAAKKMLLESAAVLRRNRVERATEERLEVDRSLHGAVVGPVGLNITRIRDETGVNVFVPRRGVEEDFITLRGAPAQIVKAKEILAEILKEAAATRVLTEEMRVEKHMHPYIIGKQGAFVRDIRDRTGVQVNIPPKDTDLSIITLRGTGDAIKKAKMMILEKLNDESGTNTGPIITETITVERSLHSWLIGKAGASIKRIRDETGVQINLPSREAASDEIVLKGTEENVEKAKRLIQKRVRAGMDDRDAVVEEVPFDKQLSAAIIGKGGETIRKLRDETGCSFFIPDAHSESSSIAIRGAAEDVARAKAIIEEKLAVAKGERQEKGAFVCPGFFDGRCHDGSDCTKGSHPPVCWMFNTPDGCPVQGVRAAVGQLFPRCPFGYHMTRTPESPKPEKLLWECSSAKADPVKRRWREGGGNPDLIEAVYQIKNPHREWLFENTRCEMTQNYNARPDMLEGFHGTAAVNIMSIASQGFSKRCRKVMVYGEGDYFAKDPRVSIGYCKGDSYMFLCRILLGKQRKTDKEEGDHIWVPDCRYYVIANGDQVLPLYVIKFRNPYSKMAEMETQIYERRATKKEAKSKFKGMGELRLCASCENELPRKEFIGAEWENPDNKLRMCKLCTEFHTAPDPVAPFLTNKLDDLDSDLRDKQTGAREPGKYHRKCEMVAETTTKLWLGYLEPSMTDDELRFDVVDFLGEYEIDRDDIRFEKEGLRRAARVTLLKPITRMEVLELNMRPYHEKYTICVDDVQPNNPARKGKLCKHQQVLPLAEHPLRGRRVRLRAPGGGRPDPQRGVLAGGDQAEHRQVRGDQVALPARSEHPGRPRDRAVDPAHPQRRAQRAVRAAQGLPEQEARHGRRRARAVARHELQHPRPHLPERAAVPVGHAGEPLVPGQRRQGPLHQPVQQRLRALHDAAPVAALPHVRPRHLPRRPVGQEPPLRQRPRRGRPGPGEGAHGGDLQDDPLPRPPRQPLPRRRAAGDPGRDARPLPALPG
eukprot:TRINITY_DN6428_c0_g1_i1.p1 TRINITY_DN6428_c0_g1~~TRINITY_DN6428_c0_g1_i1.p1  ORF type:complete len:1057 (+),score=168.45 TRINITY_DN6428_c0_g1_i1:45-3215(+)